MFKKDVARKTLALILCLVLLAGLAALPVLAAPDDQGGEAVEAPVEKAEAPAEKEDAPAEKADAPAEKEDAPAEKEDAPAEKAEAPADKEEAPAEKEDAPAEKAEAPADKEEAPADKEDAPAEKEDSPADKEEAPAEKEDAPANKEDTLADKEDTPADKEDTPAGKEETPTDEEDTPAEVEETPAPTKAPARQEGPEDEEPSDEAPAATLFGIDRADDDEDDGFVVDWAQVGTQPGGDWQVSEWGIARGNGGFHVYFSTAPNQTQTSVGITYYNDASDAIRWNNWTRNGTVLLGENQMPIRDSELTVIQEGGNYRMEGFIPDSFFKSDRFILSSGSVTLHSEDIPRLADATDMDLSEDVANESHKELDEDAKADPIGAAYTGITIDGDMSDWDAVPRYELKDLYDINGYEKTWNTVDQVSVVWDGDYVYILLVANGEPADYDPSIRVGNWTSVTGAGPNGNGQFAIVTDLNQQLLVQPDVDPSTNQPTVKGIDDAQVAVNNKEWEGAPHMWELAVPAEHLPKYLNSFDFGLYLVEPVVGGVTNLQSGDDADKTFNGVVNDGKFADWEYYPMTTIQYATPGTQDVVRDSHGALWGDGTTLYGYVATDMIAHLGAQGGEFLADITLAFNGDRSAKEYPKDGNFYPRIVAFDDLERITPNSEPGHTHDGGAYLTLDAGYRLEDGDYTFYIFDTRTDPVAGVFDPDTNTTYYPTVADLRDQAFGTIKIHVDGVLDQAEFALDLEKVADYIGQDADDAFKVIEIQWGRLGQQWISYAGTPTGPVLGVALLIGAVGAPMCYSASKKRRQAKKAASVTGK